VSHRNSLLPAPLKGVDLAVWALLIGACLAAVAVVGRGWTAVDYPVYVMAAYGFLRGEDVYAWGEGDYARAAADLGLGRYALPYRYPPLTALLAVPLVGLPAAGLWAWSALQAGAWLLTCWVLGRLGPAGARRRLIWLGVGLLMPFFAGLYAGQVNPLATLPAAAAVVLVGAGRTVGGGLLGLSLTLKPLALGLAALLLWEGRWRALFGAVITALVLLSLPAAVFGPRALNFVGAGLSAGTTSYPPAQSLPGLAARWLTAHPYGFSLADHPAAARWAGLCLSALVLAVTAAACWPPGRSGSSFQARAGLVCAAAMLANPGTWYHHATMLGIPLAVLLGRSAGRPAWWWGALALSYGLIQVWGVAWHALAGFTPLLDLATFGMLGIWALMVFEIRRKP
jgi:hypothetical protein